MRNKLLQKLISEEMFASLAYEAVSNIIKARLEIGGKSANKNDIKICKNAVSNSMKYFDEESAISQLSKEFAIDLTKHGDGDSDSDENKTIDELIRDVSREELEHVEELTELAMKFEMPVNFEVVDPRKITSSSWKTVDDAARFISDLEIEAITSYQDAIRTLNGANDEFTKLFEHILDEEKEHFVKFELLYRTLIDSDAIVLFNYVSSPQVQKTHYNALMKVLFNKNSMI
jgi:hypothetical protein